MEGDEMFSDVSFGDAVINLQSDTGANAGNPPPANNGANGDSPPPGANKPADSPPADGDKGNKPGDSGEKPLPFDQDPKWKSARAAEKTLNDTLKKFGFKSPDELAKALEHGTGLKGKIGDKDVDQLLADAAELAKLREKQNAAAEVEKRKGETPEQTIQRLERKISLQQRDFESREESRKEAARMQAEAKAYDDMVLEEVRAIQDELPAGTKQIIAHLLGVQNPVNDLELSDLATGRAMTKAVVQKVVNFVKSVQQKTIDDYAAGKSKLTATQKKNEQANNSAQNPPPGNQDKGGQQNKGTGKSQDEIFAAAENELVGLLLSAGAVP